MYECIAAHAEALSSIEMTDEEAFNELHGCLGSVMEWITKCMTQPRHSIAVGKENSLGRHKSAPSSSWRGRDASSANGCGPEIGIMEVLGVEETVCSPPLGMNGQIDMIVEACVGQGTSTVIPVELKTGKWSSQGVVSQRAQVRLSTSMYVCLTLCVADYSLCVDASVARK